MDKMFPSSNSIDDKYSPANIVDGSSNSDYNKKRLPFGAYAMVYFGTKNTMAQRAVPSIALYEASLHGYYFLTLDTGKKDTRKEMGSTPDKR